jgi:hypothetical protein
MKRLSFTFCCIFALVLGLLPAQYCYSNNSDVLIKKDSAPPPVPGRGMAPSNSVIPVRAMIDDTELFVFFDSTIGIATISTYDETGQLVYQNTIDTGLSSQLSIEVGGWDSGNYTLKIDYDSTKLVGDFQL